MLVKCQALFLMLCVYKLSESSQWQVRVRRAVGRPHPPPLFRAVPKEGLWNAGGLPGISSSPGCWSVPLALQCFPWIYVVAVSCLHICEWEKNLDSQFKADSFHRVPMNTELYLSRCWDNTLLGTFKLKWSKCTTPGRCLVKREHPFTKDYVIIIWKPYKK